ncbi:hypothetical protein NC651_031877 [Populus alba x Populus x berolinensis]|nr:hypothetical protein NC651_031877 [Populus alba x Populus x berolinensis]
MWGKGYFKSPSMIRGQGKKNPGVLEYSRVAGQWDQGGKEAGQISSVVRTLANQQALMLFAWLGQDTPVPDARTSLSKYLAVDSSQVVKLSSNLLCVPRSTKT